MRKLTTFYDNKPFITIEFDIWSSRSLQKYITLNVRFNEPAPPEGVRRHLFNLGIRLFPGKHTGETVTLKVNEMLAEFGIDCGSEVVLGILESAHDLDELAAEPLVEPADSEVEDVRDHDDDDATSGGGGAAAAAASAAVSDAE